MDGNKPNEEPTQEEVIASANILKQAMDKLMKERYEHIEKYTCAFLKEVGSEEASKYELQMRIHDDNKGATWAFVKRR